MKSDKQIYDLLTFHAFGLKAHFYYDRNNK